MCNLSYEDYYYWRDTIAEYMEEDERSRFYYVYVINPSDYYNFVFTPSLQSLRQPSLLVHIEQAT